MKILKLINDAWIMFKGIIVILVAFALMALTCVVLGSCSKKSYDYVDSTIQYKDSAVIRNQEKDYRAWVKDSIKESVYVYINGDTVREVRDRYVYRAIRDTMRIEKTDTAFVTKTVEKVKKVTKTVEKKPWKLYAACAVGWAVAVVCLLLCVSKRMRGYMLLSNLKV